MPDTIRFITSNDTQQISRLMHAPSTVTVGAYQMMSDHFGKKNNHSKPKSRTVESKINERPPLPPPSECVQHQPLSKPTETDIARKNIKTGNWTKSTALILVGMVVVFAFEGGLIGYLTSIFFPEVNWVAGSVCGIIIAGLIAIYCISHKFNLDQMHKGCTKASPDFHPEIYQMVSDLSMKAGIKTPRIYILNDPTPNAYAISNSPDDSAIAVNSGGLDLWSLEELEGILGHELSHIVHCDTKVCQTASQCAKVLKISAMVMGIVSLVSAAFLGASATTANRSKNDEGAGFLFLIIAAILIPIIIVGAILYLMVPPSAAFLQYGLSRSREYGADESSARLTGKPLALASALLTADEWCLRQSKYNDIATQNQWVVNPLNLKNRRKLTARLLDTHPSTEDRIRKLVKLEEEINGSTPETQELIRSLSCKNH